MRFEDLNLRQALAFSLQAAYMVTAKSSIYDLETKAQALDVLDEVAWVAIDALTQEEYDELMNLKYALWGVMLFAKSIREE